MTETTILYALSTIAQTCAALSAFVGAVGIYRLQSLRDQTQPRYSPDSLRRFGSRGAARNMERRGEIGFEYRLGRHHAEREI